MFGVPIYPIFEYSICRALCLCSSLFISPFSVLSSHLSRVSAKYKKVKAESTFFPFIFLSVCLCVCCISTFFFLFSFFCFLFSSLFLFFLFFLTSCFTHSRPLTRSLRFSKRLFPSTPSGAITSIPPITLICTSFPNAAQHQAPHLLPYSSSCRPL